MFTIIAAAGVFDGRSREIFFSYVARQYDRERNEIICSLEDPALVQAEIDVRNRMPNYNPWRWPRSSKPTTCSWAENLAGFCGKLPPR